ncbi:Uncharacterised protein [Corynebacterium renale]|uniref:hypothetical protein n=1 Tax=Corynebacterium renale TaxID=1724 RepID=UPI000DA29358|nr:hypothetical protein [Corynebacterium renale]SQG63459.1 Uncharacterised protein [Corynebacterium renale]STD00211.1 Uncharacterised protein [Corynebacterium renale]
MMQRTAVTLFGLGLVVAVASLFLSTNPEATFIFWCAYTALFAVATVCAFRARTKVVAWLAPACAVLMFPLLFLVASIAESAGF